ncbi:Os03g0162350 [Oryza sativa Japonica Group]|uniref:Os03g0162350 protein n=1 Tax=Oryza sativa subsp. japonica TaxID=39947 RepID=A0A0P0VTC3_ORYSJ|nr:Os03g0162350 [Oryza sativa Japonica Group]
MPPVPLCACPAMFKERERLRRSIHAMHRHHLHCTLMLRRCGQQAPESVLDHGQHNAAVAVGCSGTHHITADAIVDDEL